MCGRGSYAFVKRARLVSRLEGLLHIAVVGEQCSARMNILSYLVLKSITYSSTAFMPDINIPLDMMYSASTSIQSAPRGLFLFCFITTNFDAPATDCKKRSQDFFSRGNEDRNMDR